MIEKHNLLLIHGAWHGGWCWGKMEDFLASQNIILHVIDLPVMMNGSVSGNISLKSYTDFVKSYLLRTKGKWTIVGHSMAGIILTQVANDLPESIDKLIYLAAFVPGNGCSLMEQARTFDGKGVSTEMIFNDDYTLIDLRKNDMLKRIFYNQCSNEDVDFTYQRLRTEPAAPFSDKLSLTNPLLKKIRKHYIVCEDDNAITCLDQVKIAQMNNCMIHRINADHSPFLSQPKELSRIIIKILTEKE